MDKTEGRIQADCALWAWNDKPETRGLICYNLGNSKNKIDGARNKAMGLVKGRADMVFYWKGTATMIEFKDKDGVQSKEQIEWQSKVEAHGFKYFICRSLDEFKKIINQ